ncbi:metal ABC transporter solute-binding protein, Zn/Mn family [Agrococcus sp. HG114]|uniref:metal ABC transporter solute-binding protein, Zn/Mn family n=1 Tax=Agrococcus sp. HG114 TaxID=2969757 RepID=UPI00215B2E34|nr:zinc ABC transporter substrate-binding protein [Agrococcus sp. HG114]MCR8671268.1 zinc ABC transporter substrate-binding protein [Agrococcus sp. HG114]
MAGVAAAIAVGLALSGCATPGASAESAGDQRPLVLATFTVIADIAREVAGDAARVESLTRVGVEVHDYEPTPGDLVRTEGADLVVTNGWGIDEWLLTLVERADAPHVVLSDAVEPIPIESGHYSGSPNAHAWVAPSEGARYVEALRVAIGDLVPAERAAVDARAAALTARLDALGARLRAGVARLPERHRVLVTCEGAFSYLARDAGLDEASLWPVNAGGQGTPQSIAEVAAIVEERQVPTVFCESTTHPGTQEQIAREAGARFDGSLHVDSLSTADGPAPTYLALIEHDVDAILEGLGG